MTRSLRIIGILIVMAVAYCMQSLPVDGGEFSPRIGIVISKPAYEHRWSITQMSSHGWAGIAHLAGIPYDCLYLDELTESGIAEYNALVITQCTYVERSRYPAIAAMLEKYIASGGNIIIDGPLALYDANGAAITDSGGEMLPGMRFSGFHGNSSYRIQVTNDRHFITRPYLHAMFVTQHLANGLNILSFTEENNPLLSITDGVRTFPYLSARDSGKSRVLLVSDFATYAGASSLFRNVDPQVFYKNELFNILIRGLQWVVYGDTDRPIPAPQLSNANLTSVVRLDADASGNLDAQIRTINYLVDLAKETGVVPVYAWVSSNATRAGWQELAPLGRKIEEVGGRIGTHSKFHRIDANMTPGRWVEELDGSIEEIEFNTADYGYPVMGVEYMINPGNTIRMKDYDEVSRRMSFYMTHGFEQDMPIGFGNLTWFTGEERNFVVINNTPSPDYQWFNDPTWSYTTAQITAYQESIYDHLYNSIGRGLVYNQMWHDYAITTQPQSPKNRIINESNIAIYDAMKAKFATTDIYAPEPAELGHKIRAMKQWNYTWNSDDNGIDFTLDLTNVSLDDIADNTGGMGLRIDNTPKFIQSVSINGTPHFAFGDRIVVLPNLRQDRNIIRVELGDSPSTEPRLIYASKHITGVIRNDRELHVSVNSKTTARLAFYTPAPAVLMNTDRQEWNRHGDRRLSGSIDSGRTVVLIQPELHTFGITFANVAITGFNESEKCADLRIDSGTVADAQIRFISGHPPVKVTYNNKEVGFSVKGAETTVSLPVSETVSTLTIHF
jgi:hypothetical protein